MTDTIVTAHGGKTYFNYGEVAKIIGCSRNTVPSLLNESGVLVKSIGKSKRVSAYDLACLMATSRVSPIE